MRAAVVYFPQKNRENLLKISKSVAKGLEAQGAKVDIIDASTDVNTKLTMYSYIAIGIDTVSLFGGKINEKFSLYLANSGAIAGKRAFAFVPSALLGAQKTLLNLMKAMEKEGLFIKFSEVLSDQSMAEFVAAKLRLEKR